MKGNINPIKGSIYKVPKITVIDAATKVLVAELYRNKNVTLSMTADKEDLTGEDGMIIDSRNLSAGMTLSGESALFSLGLMEVQAGNNFVTETNTAIVLFPDVIKKDENGKFITTHTASLTPSEMAIGATDSEIKNIYYGGNYYTQEAVATAEAFSYDAATREITLPTDIASTATEIKALYFIKTAKADVLTFSALADDKTYDIYMDTNLKVPCGNGGDPVYNLMQIQGRASSGRDFELALDGTYATHSFNFTFQSGCDDDDLIKAISYTVDSIV